MGHPIKCPRCERSMDVRESEERNLFWFSCFRCGLETPPKSNLASAESEAAKWEKETREAGESPLRERYEVNL